MSEEIDVQKVVDFWKESAQRNFETAEFLFQGKKYADCLFFCHLAIERDEVPLKQVIVFGSYAKGAQKQWSDIDVCLVSPQFQDKTDALVYLLKKANEIQSKIEPHPFHPNDFVNEDPLVWEIKKTGIEVED